MCFEQIFKSLLAMVFPAEDRGEGKECDTDAHEPADGTKGAFKDGDGQGRTCEQGAVLVSTVRQERVFVQAAVLIGAS